MLLKMMSLCLMMVCHRGVASDTDELLNALAGARGGNRMSLCMGRAEWEEAAPAPRRCAGVLWRSQWVLARASCLDRRPLYKVLVLRRADGVSCDDFDKGYELIYARRVRVKFVHPESRRSTFDLALVAIDRRYSHLDPLANTSTVHQLLSELAPWMEDVCKKYPMDHRKVSYAHKSSFFSTPLRMFITTIILPSVSFMVFFLFVIFATGPKDQIPYKSIEYEKYAESEKSEEYDKSGDSPLGV